MKCIKGQGDGVVEWLMARESCCFLEQETLPSLLSYCTSWFQERIREYFYKLTAFYKIDIE